MTVPNVFEPDWDAEIPPPFSVRAARVGAAAGARRLGATVYDVEPGGAVSPYHVHHANEEMLVVLSGRPTLRTPDGTRELRAGDVAAFPRGAEGAHRVTNRSGEPARVLIVSEMNFPEVAEHLDNGSTLAITAPGTMTAPPQGHVFPAGTDIGVVEAVLRGMQASAAAEAESDGD